MGKNRTKQDNTKKYVPPPFQSILGTINRDGREVSWEINPNKGTGRADLMIDHQLAFSFVDPTIAVAKAKMLGIKIEEIKKEIKL